MSTDEKLPGMTSWDIIQLQTRLAYLFEEAAGADGEAAEAIDREVARIYATLEGSVEHKMVSLYHVVRRLEAETQGIRDEERRLAAARNAREAARDRLRAWMGEIMDGHVTTRGQSKIKAGGHTFWLQASERLEAPKDPHAWPREFAPLVPKPNAAALKKAVKAGDAVLPDGFEIVTTEGIRYR